MATIHGIRDGFVRTDVGSVGTAFQELILRLQDSATARPSTSKSWISSANISNLFRLFATIDPTKRHRGITAFIVPGESPGLSTTKLHAYGPMGLEELCAKKWIAYGDGQVRG